MTHSIDNQHTAYQLVTLTGTLTKESIMCAVNDLMKHPDYYTKHSLWDFTAASSGFSIEDLYDFVSMMRLFIPQESNFANKSALVVSGQLNRSLADMYVEISGALPFEYKVYADINAAQNFLTMENLG